MGQSGTQGLPVEPKGRSVRGFEASPLSLLPVGPLTDPGITKSRASYLSQRKESNPKQTLLLSRDIPRVIDGQSIQEMSSKNRES